MSKLTVSNRTISVCAFSFLFAYILSFPFEGKVLYGLLEAAKLDVSSFVLAAVIAHFFGNSPAAFSANRPKPQKG